VGVQNLQKKDVPEKTDSANLNEPMGHWMGGEKERIKRRSKEFGRHEIILSDKLEKKDLNTEEFLIKQPK